MLDLVIRNATIVDGTGAPSRRGDVGVRGGRIVAVGTVDEQAAKSIDADGLVLTPGFIDPHTHYDAQLFWDPLASPSNVHGVTSVLAGNCGFTLAPVKEEDADFTRRMMARVEGMPLAALEQGIKWDWSTFGEYLDRLDGKIGVNAGFLVGHCAVRRYVMGADRSSELATDDEVAAMARLVHESIDAGGLGFSTTRSSSHADGDGLPVPSRMASAAEVLALCAAAGEHEGTTLEVVSEGCNHLFSDDEVDLFVKMSQAANRPLNWNVLTLDGKVPERLERQMQPALRAQAAGNSKVIALTMPVLVSMNMSLLTFCALFGLPGWKEVLELPVPERIAKLKDPATQQWMVQRAQSPEAGVFGRLSGFEGYVIGDTYSPENEGLKGRLVGDIARERNTTPFGAMVDIAANDQLRTVLWPSATDDDAISWEMRRQVWDDPNALIGGSDAGAHLDRMCGSSYTTQFLADTIRGRKLISLERAVQLMTDKPARLFGLRDRGRIAPGMIADLVLFDPDTVDAEAATLVNDLPGNSRRLTAGAKGVEAVFVNGVQTVRSNQGTGDTPGIVLRSGRDTDTVTAR